MSYDICWYRLPREERVEREYTDDEKRIMKEHSNRYCRDGFDYDWHTPFEKESTGLNITSNLWDMFTWAMGVSDWKIVDGMKGRDAFRFVNDSIKKMEKYPKEARLHESPNGWGTYEYALVFLKDLRAECVYYRDFYLGILY